MNESTNSKVHFFRHIIELAIRGKLKTAGPIYCKPDRQIVGKPHLKSLSICGYRTRVVKLGRLGNSNYEAIINVNDSMIVLVRINLQQLNIYKLSLCSDHCKPCNAKVTRAAARGWHLPQVRHNSTAARRSCPPILFGVMGPGLVLLGAAGLLLRALY
jgi:hypothetical protein